MNNCSVTGKVTGLHSVGGMGGRLVQGIINSYVDVVVQGGDDSGGFVGRTSSGTTFITHSRAKGSVQQTGSATIEVYLGGLVGFGDVYIIRSYANVTVSGGNLRGSLLGAGEEARIRNFVYE